MGESRLSARFTTLLFAVLAVSLFFVPRHAAEAAVLHNVNGWAWSGTTGWISTNCEDPKPGFPAGDCAPANGNYGLDIDNTGNLSGWAWSTSTGWICFGATCTPANSPPLGIPTIDNNCQPPTSNCSPYARIEPSDYQLHGWAYVASETDGTDYRGWISLNCTDTAPNTALPHDCGASDYAVAYDDPTGYISGWGWNGNGDVTGNGWVQFACDAARPCAGASGDWGVTTGWINSGWDSMDTQEGVYSPPPLSSTGLDQSSIAMTFRNLSAPANATLRCYLAVSDGTYKTIDYPIVPRTSGQTLTETYDLLTTDPAVDVSGNPVNWVFSAPPGPPPYGCEIIGVPPVQKAVSNVIAVHPVGWTFQGGGGSPQADSNRAANCLQGNLGSDPATSYFQNTSQCDTDGDLAFTLLKAKGIKVETFCRDNVDNDVNGATDFTGTCNVAVPIETSDRTCRGITYLCILPKPILPCDGSCSPPAP